jgi:hypothetical protein
MNFIDFADWLFPGDELPARVRNAAIPGAAQDILEQVACATGVSVSWLQRAARLVLDGLAGAQCLWYLHGLEGEIATESELPPWFHDYLANYCHKEFLKLQDKTGEAWFVTSDPNYGGGVDYGAGMITIAVYPMGDGFLILRGEKQAKLRKLKIGKFLRKVGAQPHHIKEFETRDPGVWHWRISAHPFDVLTMSFNRPWTSCMRPGGVAELGPLTDMAAGSAVMFFYRPGADKACGRVILRPFLETYQGVLWSRIAFGGTVYGCGPAGLTATQVNAVLRDAIPEFPEFGVDLRDFCSMGHTGEALTRAIYSDTDRDYCQQTDEQYDAAYENLVNADWPPPRLDLGDLPLQAAEARELVGESGGESLVSVLREVVDLELQDIGWGQLLLMDEQGDWFTDEMVEEVRERIDLEDEQTSYEFANQLWEMANERMRERLEEIGDDSPILVVVHEEDALDWMEIPSSLSAWEIMDEQNVFTPGGSLLYWGLLKNVESAEQIARKGLFVSFIPMDLIKAGPHDHGKPTIDTRDEGVVFTQEMPPGSLELWRLF